jgi:DNA polymerase I
MGSWLDRAELAGFEEIWFVDFEFISRPGEHPDVLCLCAHEARSGRHIQLWEDRISPTPPYRIDEKALFVAFVANAECNCHLALNWPMPSKVLDLSPWFRCLINGDKVPPEGKGVIGALSHFGLDTVDQKYKDAMRDRILAGRPFSVEEKAQILQYCMSDVVGLPALMERLLDTDSVDLSIALHWGEFCAVSAAMEFRGVPINTGIADLLFSKEAWAFIRDPIVPRINPQ